MDLDRLDDCFRKGLLRRVEASDEKSRTSLEEAQNWLDEAGRSYEGGALRASLTSSYLVYFHSARALLFRDGIREKSHYCIGVYLDHYVKIEELEPKWTTLFHAMRTQRQTEQYSFGTKPSKKEVLSHLRDAESFMERMKVLLQREKQANKA